MIDYNKARKIATALAAIGEPTRLRILYQLIEGEQNVGSLAEAVGVSMVNMSHHLGVMRQAGLLEDEKDGRRVIYRLRRDLYLPEGDGPGTSGVLKIGGYRLIFPRDDSAGGNPKKCAAKKPPL